ncbi:MAG TPA: metal-dependent hydrolase [Chloroflexia bacterium]|nr:metal-dependent hydrolase [Chloroflexia bacterium]
MNGRTHTTTGIASVLVATYGAVQLQPATHNLPAPLATVLAPPSGLLNVVNSMSSPGAGSGKGSASLSLSLDGVNEAASTATTVVTHAQAPALILVVILLIGIVGGQFPDIDQPTSTIANSGRAMGRMMHGRGIGGFFIKLLFGIINFLPHTMALIANNFFGGHRGVIHSLLAMLVVSSLIGTATYFFFGSAFYGTLFGVGYLTHLLADMLTRSGIKLLLPFSDKDFWLLPAGIRFKSDSEWQNGLVQFLALAVIAVSGWSLISVIV